MRREAYTRLPRGALARAKRAEHYTRAAVRANCAPYPRANRQPVREDTAATTSANKHVPMASKGRA